MRNLSRLGQYRRSRTGDIFYVSLVRGDAWAPMSAVKDGGFLAYRGLSHQVLRCDDHYITWVCEVYRGWIKRTAATEPSTFPTCLWCARQGLSMRRLFLSHMRDSHGLPSQGR